MIEVDAPSGWRCPQHKRASQWKPAPAYGTQRWRRLRNAYIAEHPRCERCGAPAEQVHHRNHASPSDPSFWLWSNLESVCEHDHRVLTGRHGARVQAGQGGR